MINVFSFFFFFLFFSFLKLEKRKKQKESSVLWRICRRKIFLCRKKRGLA